MTHLTNRSLTILLLTLPFCLLPGCRPSGPRIAPVTGIVTMDGQPLPGAAVIFRPAEGRFSSARTDGSGRYELIYLRDKKGAIVGPHKVVITTRSESVPVEKVPAQYNTDSTLTAEVADGSNEFDFQLEP